MRLSRILMYLNLILAAVFSGHGSAQEHAATMNDARIVKAIEEEIVKRLKSN